MSSIYGRQTVYSTPYFAKCIYSGNKRSIPYDIQARSITPEMQERYNFKFMKEECECKSCTEKRKETEKLIQRLWEDKAYDSLRALGVDV